MNDDSVNLLQSINSGCKNATNSIEKTLEFVKNIKLKEILEYYKDCHTDIGDMCHVMLEKIGAREEDPSVIEKMMTLFATEMKMTVNANDSHVAQLMMDGCNMGIENILKAGRKYNKADHEVYIMVGRLVNMEEEMYKRMTAFL